MDAIRTFLRSHVVWSGAACVAAYWLAAAFVPPEALIQILNCILIGIAIAVTISYAPGVVEAIRRDRMDRLGQLTLGIVLSWFAVIINRSWAGSVRIFDEEWMRSSPIIGFYIFLAILAGTLHLTAPGALDGYVPRRNWIVIGCAVGFGVVMFALLIVAQTGLAIFQTP